MSAGKHGVLAALQHHIGERNGVRAEVLAKRLDINPRRLRSIISELIEDGIAVCGHPASGYYIAQTSTELEATVQFHKSRALHELRKAAALQRIPLPDLIGQLKLPT